MEAKNDVPLYAAGHTKHEWTSWSCMQKIFDDMDRVFEYQDNSAATGDGQVGDDSEDLKNVENVEESDDRLEKSDLKMDTSDSTDKNVIENQTRENSETTIHSEEL